MAQETKDTKDTKYTCSVCYEKYNKSTHKMFECPSCEFDCCRECIKTYLLNSNDAPHCMKCKNGWTRDILIDATLKSFVNNEYKNHTKNILFDAEKSRLPETMSEVDNHLKCKKLKCKISDNKDIIKKKKEELAQLINKNRIYETRLYLRETGQHKDCKKQFIKKCPAEGCRGFLSSDYQCGICNKYTCPKCFAIKESDDESKNPEHVCKEEDLKTADMIRSECKNCPGCGTHIFKTEGCDQMWCTQCHIAFSWKTGLKMSGVIHNPHFIEWQNSGEARAPINIPGAIMCGGMPRSHDFKVVLFRNFGLCHHEVYRKCFRVRNEIEKYCVYATEVQRSILYFSNTELNRIRTECNDNQDNKDLRIKYILKEINEDFMKNELEKRKKRYEKARTILDVYELINMVFTESIRDIYETLSGNVTDYDRDNCLGKNFERLNRIRQYVNEELKKISITYSQSIRCFNPRYHMVSIKFSKKDLKYTGWPKPGTYELISV